jgi:hypothetical protein
VPVFNEKEQHVLIQLETDEDWQRFYNCCEGYMTPKAFQLISQYLNGVAKTIVLEKG